MTWSDQHPFTPAARFDGGNLDCGNGLLLLIRRNIDPLEPGQLLEILSTDGSVEEDLPSWCRLTGNTLVSRTRAGPVRSYLVRKGEGSRRRVEGERPRESLAVPDVPVAVAAPALPLPPLAVMGVGSWPRPAW